MILIADSGATKADWCVLGPGGEVMRFRTAGVNVSVMSECAVREVLSDAAGQVADAMMAGRLSGSHVSKVHFFSAGLVDEDAGNVLKRILEGIFCKAAVDVDTDLMAAAKALWGDMSGIVAILGTGSNSCLYDGVRIVKNIRPGGFVLGDEGGGAALGKMLLADFVKGLLPEDIMAKLHGMGLDYATVVKNVYRGTNPSAYLASFAPFVFENIGCPYMAGIVEDNFRAFVRRSLTRYGEDVCGTLEVGVIGSVGCAGKEILKRVASREGLVVGRCLGSPIEGLAKYYGEMF